MTSRLYLMAGTAITMLMYDVRTALAQGGKNTIGGRLDEMYNEMTSIKNFTLIVAALIGVIFLIMGIIKLTKREGGDGGVGKALVFIIAGGLLTGIPALLLYTSGTLFGNNDTITVTNGRGSF